jgi:hypothetical protein
MSSPARRPLPFFAAALLAACAIGPNTSYVSGLRQPSDVQVLTNGLAELVSLRLPLGSGMIVLDPTPADQSGNAFTEALVSALQLRGFAVARDTPSVAANAHHVRYLITSLDNGDLARLTIDGTAELSQFFVRDDAGDLEPGGPITLTQAEIMR